MKIVIVGGGWAGCAASAQAAKSGASVTLLERTDSLLGTGLVGGIIRNNGRFTATEEMAAMGGDDMFRAMDLCLRHKCISFPGHIQNTHGSGTAPASAGCFHMQASQGDRRRHVRG